MSGTEHGDMVLVFFKITLLGIVSTNLHVSCYTLYICMCIVYVYIYNKLILLWEMQQEFHTV